LQLFPGVFRGDLEDVKSSTGRVARNHRGASMLTNSGAMRCAPAAHEVAIEESIN
jgi:hypothetical protein